MRLLLIWLINAVSLLAVAHFIPSITVASFTSALFAAVVLGFVNTLIRPVLVLLTLPVTILTLGGFILVINGLLFWLVGSVLTGFVVTDFWGGFWGAMAYSVVSWLLSVVLVPAKG